MELVIAIVLVAIGVIWYFNAQKGKKVAEAEPAAPYKVEPPKTVVLEPVVVTAKTAAVAEVKVEAPAEAKPAKAKKPAAKKAKTATAKTATAKTTAKKQPNLKRSK